MLGLIRGILDTKQPRRLFVACFLAFLHQALADFLQRN